MMNQESSKGREVHTMEEMKSVFVNGFFLHYLEAGRGEPVVLVHGNGEDHTMFQTEIAQLTAAGYRVYALDSRGHGANEPVKEYHYADMAEDVYAFIQALGLTRPAYYGHSDGGILGLLLSIRHPGVLSRMAVSGANLSPDGLQESFLQEYGEKNRLCPQPLFDLMLTEPHIDPEELKKIEIPVLVTAGEHDLVLQRETEKIASSLPNSSLIILPGENHESYIAGSETMGKLLIDFFSKWKKEP